MIYFPANIAALSIIFATQLTNLLQLSTDYLLLIAVITAVSVTGLNLLGTKVGASVQSVTLIVKLIPIAVIVIWGLLTPGQGTVSYFNRSWKRCYFCRRIEQCVVSNVVCL